MKRYDVEYANGSPNGDWVEYKDALAEIAAAVKQEREEICEEYEKWLSTGGNETIGVLFRRIRARGKPPEPKPLKHVTDMMDWPETINALVDAVNELRALS